MDEDKKQIRNDIMHDGINDLFRNRPFKAEVPETEETAAETVIGSLNDTGTGETVPAAETDVFSIDPELLEFLAAGKSDKTEETETVQEEVIEERDDTVKEDTAEFEPVSEPEPVKEETPVEEETAEKESTIEEAAVKTEEKDHHITLAQMINEDFDDEDDYDDSDDIIIRVPEEKEERPKKHILKYVLLALAVIAVLLAGFFIFSRYRDKILPDRQEEVIDNSETETQEEENTNAWEQQAKATIAWNYNDPIRFMSIEEWKKACPEVRYVMQIYGREFPVMGTREDDPDYYLDHDVNGANDIFGTPFIEEGHQSIITAHSVYGDYDLMFNFVDDYFENDAIYQRYPLINLVSEEGTKTYQIAALVRANIRYDEWTGWTTVDPDWPVYQNWVFTNAEKLYTTNFDSQSDYLMIMICDIDMSDDRVLLIAKATN